MWINAATSRVGPHKHPMSEQSRTGSFNVHQRALYSAGRDPRYVDTRLQGASGEILQQVTQKAESRQQSRREALNRTPKAGGAGHLAVGTSRFLKEHGERQRGASPQPGHLARAHQLCEETRVELNSQTCFKPGNY